MSGFWRKAPVLILVSIPSAGGSDANIWKGNEMKGIIFATILILSLVLSGCSGGKAEELFETAKLEELQNAQDHAIKLYQEIVDKYPDSEYAQRAKERLSALKAVK